MDRPAPQSGADAFHAYLHLRGNPAGVHRELWQHSHGCMAWLVVERNVTSHEILNVALARDVAGAGE